MSLGSGLRVRKDMETHVPGSDEEAAYLLTPAAELDGHPEAKRSRRRKIFFSSRHSKRTLVVMFSIACLGLVIILFISSRLSLQAPTCMDTANRGYQCQRLISQFWGQYSPFFSVPSEIPDDILLPDCEITFAQLLSRHGARDPTASKTKVYDGTIQKLKANVKHFPGKYSFLDSFAYTLGADQLTTFGEQEMVNSGIAFYDRYEKLAKQSIPFIRSSGEERVVKSAQNLSQGFHLAKTASDKQADANYPYPILVIPEGAGINNTLNHDLCTAFENREPYSSMGSKAQQTFLGTFLPPITTRLNTDLAGANLTATDTINVMDLCPFITVASPVGAVSPFCGLFTEDEWHHYDYYQTLGKYYGYGPGNPLGPTQGVGFVNELVARMTRKPVNDQTTVNHTLDDSGETFPLGDALYVDVSHDNDITAIFSALGLYNSTAPLSNTSIETAQQTKGYSAAWTVPFAAKAYFEKTKCRGSMEEFVRIIVNGRTLPLETCGGDALGRCTLTKFVQSLSFAAQGGKWNLCFKT